MMNSKSLKFSLFLFLTTVTLVTCNDEGNCTRELFYTVCRTESALTSVTKAYDGSEYFRWLFAEGCTSIAPNTFKNLPITELELDFYTLASSSPVDVTFTPESFTGLPSLKKLIITGATFSLSPNPFKHLPTLTHLRIDRSGIEEIPAGFFSNFPQLKTFILHANVSHITPEIFSSVTDNLEKLELKMSVIKTVEPKSFESLRHLKELSLSGQKIVNLQPDILYGLNNLEILKLTGLGIETIAQNTFKGLSQLKQLDLSSNDKLANLEPGVFDGLTQLKALVLSYDEIGHVRHNVFNTLTNLGALKMDTTAVTKFDPYAFSGLNLVVLDLSDSSKRFEIGADTFNGLNATEVDLKQLVYDPVIQPNAFRGAKIHKLTLNRQLAKKLDRQLWGLDELVLVLEQARDLEGLIN